MRSSRAGGIVMKKDQLKRIRKSPLVIFLLIIVSFIPKLLEEDVKGNATNAEPQKSLTERFNAKTYIATQVVNERPIDIRNIFHEEERRVYFYSRINLLNELKELQQLWYLDTSIVKKVDCDIQSSICYSSLSPRKLRAGLWSVDLIVNNNILLSSQQFLVKPSSNR